MPRTHLLTLSGVIFTFLISCSLPQTLPGKLAFPGSLTGTWRTVSPDSSRFETWKPESETSYSGTGGLLAGNDSLVTEALMLEKISDKWIYFATVSGQNNGKTVSFSQTQQTETSVEFSNPDHDFPKKLIYTLLSGDTLQVTVSGGTDSFTLRFVRQPDLP